MVEEEGEEEEEAFDCVCTGLEHDEHM